MAKYYSFIVKNVNPLSQNNRPTRLLQQYRTQLIGPFQQKYRIPPPAIRHGYIRKPIALHGKAIYIHKAKDSKDADNISKPLWDALNMYLYDDDNQIIHRQVVKAYLGDPDIYNLHEFDLTHVGSTEFTELVYFILDSTNTDDRLIYIDISDYESKNVKF